MGYILCSFENNDVKTTQGYSKISFNTISSQYGNLHYLVNSSYEECLTATFQICKNPCTHKDMLNISVEEERELMRWLNKRTFRKFKILSDDYINLFFEASFNIINRIEFGQELYGLELEMITNRPFALQEPQIISIINTSLNEKHIIYDTSDEEGYIYPNVEIKVLGSGNLNIHNTYENRNTIISNCSNGEIITMDYPVIYTSCSSHKIENDFNWNFIRIGNTFIDRKNTLTMSLPCEIKITYSPIVKIGI